MSIGKLSRIAQWGENLANPAHENDTLRRSQIQLEVLRIYFHDTSPEFMIHFNLARNDLLQLSRLILVLHHVPSPAVLFLFPKPGL